MINNEFVKRNISNALYVIAVFVLLFSLMLSQVSCNQSSGQSSDQSSDQSSTPTESKESIAYNHATAMALEGKHRGAYMILKQLGEYKDSESLSVRYERNSVIEKSIISAISALKPQLKNPSSFVLYGFAIYSTKSTLAEGSYYLSVELTYGATNSFGGMVKDTYIHFEYVDQKFWEYLKTYEGQRINTYFIKLSTSELSRMTMSEYNKWTQGDHVLYLKTRTDIPENIWNQ